MKELKHRIINKKYLQAGYYENGKWILVEHLGTVKHLVELVRQEKALKTKYKYILKTPEQKFPESGHIALKKHLIIKP